MSDVNVKTKSSLKTDITPLWQPKTSLLQSEWDSNQIHIEVKPNKCSHYDKSHCFCISDDKSHCFCISDRERSGNTQENSHWRETEHHPIQIN